MKHIVSFGGGITSYELALEVVRKYGAENTEILLAGLAMEHPDLYRVLAKTEADTGIKATTITASGYKKHGYPSYLLNAPQCMWFDIWDVFLANGLIGNTLFDICSRVLKRDILRDYVQTTYAKGEAVIHVGITSDEARRITSIQERWHEYGYAVEADLMAIDLDAQGDKSARALLKLGFVPDLYLIGNHNNNCHGACVKAPPSQWVRLLINYPAVFWYHATQEQRWQDKWQRANTILRKQSYTLETVSMVSGDGLPMFPALLESQATKKKYKSVPYSLIELARDVNKVQTRMFNTLDMIITELGMDDTQFGCTTCESVA